MPRKKKWTDETFIEIIKNSSYIGQVCKKLNSTYNTVKKYIKLLNLDISHFETPTKHTQQTKDKLSKLQKDNLKNNNLNRWSFVNRGQPSLPEMIFEKALIESGLSFIKQYIPPENDRFFILDFALIEKKIAFEINGNQHYDGGKLKEYYQNRHNYFIKKGWVIHEIHFYESLNIDRAMSVIQKCLKHESINYDSPQEIIIWKDRKNLIKDIERINIKLEKYKNYFSNYNELKSLVNTNFLVAKDIVDQLNVNKLPRISKRKVLRPSKEELEKMLLKQSISQIAKTFGVSYHSIKKWCRCYGIDSFVTRYISRLPSVN